MHAILTLVEKDFLYGAAVLLNSLVKNGFTGKFFIGYRTMSGMPANVVRQLLRAEADGVEIVWFKVHGEKHFANAKPDAMILLFEREQLLEKVTYLDPDIVVECPWTWMDSWCSGGPVLFADVNWMMPSQHPTRREWTNKIQRSALNKLDIYFNSGFLSITREDSGFAALWREITNNFGSEANPLDGNGDVSLWRKGGRWMSFFSPNQDTLNATAMLWDGPLVTFGPDAMGFSPGIRVISHAVGVSKPWRKNYLIEALRGYPPSFVDKSFWQNAKFPFSICSALGLGMKHLSILMASALGRFYRRRA